MSSPHVIFVCWGNICRSPMAEAVARHWAERDGVDAVFSSAGVSSEEAGNPMDARAVAALLSDWFPATTGEIVHVDGGVHAMGL